MRPIRGVTVLGANGTMGQNIAAIFASFGNANVYLVSRTIEKSVQARERAYLSVRADSVKTRMIPSEYEQLEECVKNSELIFEACAEDWSVKKSIHEMLSDILKRCNSEKIICSGTSGLSITEISELYEFPYRRHVVGMHFFNPPYQMTLCELTPTVYTDKAWFNDLSEYTRSVLLRTTVIVKDSPAFLGNRIGFQFINHAMQLAEQYKYNGGIDYIDAIFGMFTGRAMAPLVTSNFVGLDVHKAIVENIYVNTDDFLHQSFEFPAFAAGLVREGKLGRKTGEGLYKTVLHGSGVKIHQVYDIDHGYYRETIHYTFPFAEEMISHLQTGDYRKAFEALEKNHSAEAELCLNGLINYVLYSLEAAGQVSDDIHAADDVMATGFNWCPPLAMVEALGGKDNFAVLCRERVQECVLSDTKREELLSEIDKSKYDYRRFFKAKR